MTTAKAAQEQQFVVQQCYLEDGTQQQANDRGARIIKLATKIMANGQARGWSDAIRQAKEQAK
jgi:hypothetical protein